MSPGPIAIASPGSMQILEPHPGPSASETRFWAHPCVSEQALQMFVGAEPGKYIWAAPGPSIWGSSSREDFMPPLRQVLSKISLTGSHLYGNMMWIPAPSLRLGFLIGKVMNH